MFECSECIAGCSAAKAMPHPGETIRTRARKVETSWWIIRKKTIAILQNLIAELLRRDRRKSAEK